MGGLYRSRSDRWIAGVMGGLADRWGVSANVLRLLFVIFSIVSAAFPGMIVYIVLWLIIPLEPRL